MKQQQPRHSQTTSPSMQPTSPTVDDGRDQWDMQLAGIPSSNNTNNNNHYHHHNNNQQQGNTPQHMMNNNSGSAPAAGRRTSSHRGATPPTGSSTRISSAHQNHQNQQQLGSSNNNIGNNNNNSSGSIPSTARFVKEQMIRAAVSSMIQCQINVPTSSFLEFHLKSDADLDNTFLQIQQILSTHMMNSSGNNNQQQQQINNNNNGVHVPVSSLNQEINFDPAFMGGSAMGPGFIQERMAPRPQAPIGHQRTPIVSAGGSISGPGTASGASPPLVRLSTPALNNLNGVHHPTRNTPLYKSTSSVGNSSAAAGHHVSFTTPRNSNSAGHINNILNSNNNDHSPVYGNNNNNGYYNNNNNHHVVSPGASYNNTNTNYQQSYYQQQQQQAAAAHQQQQIQQQQQLQQQQLQQQQQQQSGGMQQQALSDTSSSQGSMTVKPRPTRAPYNASHIPSQLGDNVARVKQHSTNMKVARSVSSAFSQHSASTSTSQMIQPSNRNNNSVGSTHTNTAPITARSDETAASANTASLGAATTVRVVSSP